MFGYRHDHHYCLCQDSDAVSSSFPINCFPLQSLDPGVTEVTVASDLSKINFFPASNDK